MQLRFEALNLLNHPNFANPGGDISNAGTFGIITATTGTGERNLRFGARCRSSPGAGRLRVAAHRDPRPASLDPLAGGPLASADLDALVEEVVARTPFVDVHTHLFPSTLRTFSLWGIDDLLTYHYLEAELFRVSAVRPQAYWTLPKSARADLVWRTLFVDQTPLSEATRGVVSVLHMLGLIPRPPAWRRCANSSAT